MARPTKETVDYFPHFIKGGKTLFVLENDFGNDGYAFWFKLLEILGSTEGMVFDYGNPANKRFLLSKTKVNEDLGLRIIETLVDVEAIDRELWENHQLIWVQKLVDNVKDAFKKRTVDAPKKPLITSGGNTQQVTFLPPETTSDDDSEKFPAEETGKLNKRKLNNKEKTISPETADLKIKDFRLRYSPEQLQYIDDYLEMIRHTRKGAKIADTVKFKIYEYFDKFPPVCVEYAVRIHTDTIAYHSRDETYTFGIIRKTTAEEAFQKLNRPDTTGKQGHHHKSKPRAPAPGYEVYKGENDI